MGEKPKRLAKIVLLVTISMQCVIVAHQLQGITEASSRSSKWPAVRSAYLTIHPDCEFCGCEGIIDPVTKQFTVDVHHVIPVSEDPEGETRLDNLVTLCNAPHGGCHLFFGHHHNFRTSNKYIRKDIEFMSERIERIRRHWQAKPIKPPVSVRH